MRYKMIFTKGIRELASLGKPRPFVWRVRYIDKGRNIDVHTDIFKRARELYKEIKNERTTKTPNRTNK